MRLRDLTLVFYPSRIAGQVHELDHYSHVSGRLVKKIDVFSHMALVASEQAIKDSGMDLEKLIKIELVCLWAMLLVVGFLLRLN